MTGKTYRSALQSIALERAAGEDVEHRITALAASAGLDRSSVDAEVTEAAEIIADA